MEDKTYQEQRREDAREAMDELTNAVMKDDKEAVSDRELLERMARVLLLIGWKDYVG